MRTSTGDTQKRTAATLLLLLHPHREIRRIHTVIHRHKVHSPNNKKNTLRMKGFPVFNTTLSPVNANEIPLSPEELKKHLDLKQEQREEVTLAFGLCMAAKKALPPNFALLVDQEKEVVVACANGRLVCLPKRDRINHAKRLPTTIKKKRCQNSKVARAG